MWITHSYLGTTRHGTKCLFFLLFEDYIEAQSGLSAQLESELERFARNLGDAGALVRPFAGDVATAMTSIRDKHWPHETIELLQNTPAILMIDRDFDDFDPRYHPWVLLHFERHSNQDATQFHFLLQKITESVTSENSDPIAIVRKALEIQELRDAAECLELKPEVFGISLDLKKAYAAFKTYLRSQKSGSTAA